MKGREEQSAERKNTKTKQKKKGEILHKIKREEQTIKTELRTNEKKQDRNDKTTTKNRIT